MKKIVVVAEKVPHNIRQIINIDKCIFYASDRAIEPLLQQNIPIELAIGDFDSLEDKSLLDNIKTIKLSVLKDDSDSAYALRHAYQQTDDVVLLGGIKGNRADHFVANLLLLEKYPNLVIMDDTNIIRKLLPGSYNLSEKTHSYLSIFPLEDSTVTLTNALYPLDNETLFKFDVIGLSNKIISKNAALEIHTGEILLIESSDK